ncbi:MAG: cell division protein FtsA [Candidatus Gracilibacteria bacterium]|nr:cell division protein FtsA [Candidatus Gracilibacteria bacterium]
MSIENAIACIDIGSSKIRTIIGTFDGEDKKNLHILGVGISESNAIRKGNILDMEEFKSNLDKSLEEAEKMAGEQVHGAFISFNSSSFEVDDSKGIIAISGEEIEAGDIERVLDMAKNGRNMPNREILKVIPDNFVVDLEDGIKSPIGMSARKLEAKANIFSISSNILNNIKKSIEDVGIEVYDVFPNLISAPEGVLTKRQKELGVVCIDIGASTTGITVYEEGSLKFSKIIPIGGDSVTNDIALGVRTSIDTAEKLKIEFGELNLDKIENYKDIEIDLSKVAKGEEGIVSSVYLSKIITARYDEIFYFVRDELKKIGKDGMLPEGAVIVGNGAKMRGLIEISKDILRLPVVIGVPACDDLIADTSINDPSFAGVLGTLILANKYRDARNVISFNFYSIFASITKVFKKLLP